MCTFDSVYSCWKQRGRLRMARGRLRMARGRLRMARGRLRVARGRLRVARGRLRVGSRLLTDSRVVLAIQSGLRRELETGSGVEGS